MVSTLKLLLFIQAIVCGVAGRQLKQYDNSPSPDPWEPGAPRYYCADTAYAMTQPPYNYPGYCYQDPGCTQMGIDLSTLQSSCNGGCSQMCGTALSGLSLACRYELVTWQDQWAAWLANQVGQAPLGYNPWTVGFQQCGLPYTDQGPTATTTTPTTPTTVTTPTVTTPTVTTPTTTTPTTTTPSGTITTPTGTTTLPTVPSGVPTLVGAGVGPHASILVLFAAIGASFIALI